MSTILRTYAAYKSHLEHLETVISNPSHYTPSNSKNAVSVTTDSLRLARVELKADIEQISKAVDAIVVKTATHAPEVWAARLPILKKSPEPSPGALQWLLYRTLGWPCTTPSSPIVPGMVGKFDLTGSTPTTHEFSKNAATTLLTGFTSLRMGPRKTGIKVNLTQKPIDAEHITFALETPRAPDSATVTFFNPARCGPTAQHGSVAFDSVNTEQPPPLSIVVPFPHPFASTPQVVVWLSALDFVSGCKLAVETRAANVTPAGFTLFVTGLMDLPRALNQVSWVAFEETPGIVSGTFVMGKGSGYACERWSKAITTGSEVWMGFNTFSGPPDVLEYVINEPEVVEGKVSVVGRSVNKGLCSTGVAYIVFPKV